MPLSFVAPFSLPLVHTASTRSVKFKCTATPPQRGLYLDRRTLESQTRQQKSYRTKRWTTLGDLDAGPPDEEKVLVSLMVRRARRDFVVQGLTKTKVGRVCDRCACAYNAESRGKFEVWLATAEDGRPMTEEEPEAVEGFGKGVVGIDVGVHVRDAVLLGVPSKSLCRNDCGGVADVQVDVKVDLGDMGAIGDREGVGEVLEELRRKLQEQGL